MARLTFGGTDSRPARLDGSKPRMSATRRLPFNSRAADTAALAPIEWPPKTMAAFWLAASLARELAETHSCTDAFTFGMRFSLSARSDMPLDIRLLSRP